jgi:hypothetical protein
MTSDLASTAALAKRVRRGDDVVVYGSADDERGAGDAALALLRRWRAITFHVAEAREGGDGARAAWGVAKITRTVKRGAEVIREPYWTLVILVHAGPGWQIVGLQYTQEPPRTD